MSFLLYTVFLGASIGSLPELWAKIQKAIGATEKLMELFDIQTEEIIESADDIRVKGKIEFRDVHFSYPTRPDIEVLKGFSFFEVDKRFENEVLKAFKDVTYKGQRIGIDIAKGK